MYYLPTTLIFIGLATAVFIYTLKNREEKKKNRTFTNEILVGSLLLLGGVLFPFMYASHSNLSKETLDFLWITTSIILVIEVTVFFGILYKNARKCKKDPDLKVERSYEAFKDEFLKTWKWDLKKDFDRKLLHLLPVGVIFVLWTIGFVLESIGFLDRFGLDNYAFSLWLIITAGYAFCIMFVIEDIVRLKAFHIIPDYGVKWIGNSLIKDELDTFVSSAPLVVAFSPFVFAPFPILAMIALISAVSDSLASLVGKKYGKHRFGKDSLKTIEGYLAGVLSTFLFVILIAVVYHPLMTVGVGTIFMMAIVASIIFFLVDAVLSDIISDNILNPLLTGFGIWVVVILL